MKLSYQHGTTKARALELLKARGDLMSQNLGPQVSEVHQEWHADGLDLAIKVFGFTIKGRMLVAEQTVDMEVDLPWIARSREDELRSRALKTLDELFRNADEGKEQTV
ncbi:MAG: polyhydroxyalkanoic acid system family protein [Chloroflexota bacterium]|nr:polyhydroxyalkanoic acid system family protein [Chloroflexota bacterium]MDE2940896.1 polyhydroxyalkanoic acid system family protein [Chloroflexota bacterium]MDE3268403.1 polyhydroxyalkanoic acid system family protein [Chloroflexota bacterium]